MKRQESTLWKTWLKVAVCAAFGLLMACSDNGSENEPSTPTPTPTPTPGTSVGTIDFNLKTEDGTSLPTQGPVQVESQQGLELVISQKSSYTDPNGKVYTCEPKASIALEASLDTVYAKDIKALTTINGNPKAQTGQSGSNPVKKTTQQVFSIGEQDIFFDLAHEIYTYTNSKQQKIEMPYILVGQAKYGDGTATESKAASSPITLRSLSLSRASVTDSTLYEVDAKFSLEVSTVNTKESQKQTLNFEVGYLAVVENVTELTGVVEYTLDQTDMVIQGGEEATVTLEQQSKFMNGEEPVYEARPQTSLSLKAANAQVFVGAVEELTALIDTEDARISQEGSNPTTHSFQKRWATKNQSFDWTTAYQVCYAETGEEMPYLKVNEPKLVGIEATEKASRVSINDTVYYDVKATFEVELESRNVSEAQKQTLSFVVDYEGAVVKTLPLTPALDYTLKQTAYTVQGGEDVEIAIRQQARYLNGEQAVYSHEPVATLKLTSGKALVYAAHADAFREYVEQEAQTAKEGNQPLTHTYRNTWKAGEQTFEWETAYQVFTAESGDEMPYLKFGEPKLVSVDVVEKTSRASVSDTIFYDVKANFEVKVEGVNVDNAISETLSFDVSYDGGVVSTTELSGNIDYTINGGSGTSFSVSGGDAIDVELKQNNAYLLGGSVIYSAEGVANVSLSVKNAMVYASSLDKLKEMLSSDNAKTSSSGTNPKKYSYTKSLKATGQSFDFSASYDVYTAQSGDEMPYLKIGEPKLVSIEAVEKSSRASVSDTVFYDIKTKMEVKIEGVNVDNAISETLSFEANYEGGVVSTTELSGEIDYTINGGSSSSFNVSAGEEASVVLKQTSVYSLNGQELYRYEPEAVISFKALNSEVYVESLDALKTLIESEDATKSSSGSNPKKYSYLKSLATNGQSFDFSASYEVYNAENGEEMPYLKVGEPRLVSIDAVERTSRATVNDTVFYDVKAVFEVDVEGVNVEKALAQTISFEVNYEGGVVSKTEGPVELVSTDYRKDLIYLEPVGNLIARTSCVVYRDRKYSDGSVQTDSIYGGPWMMLECRAIITQMSSEEIFVYGNVETDYNDAGIYIRSASVEVPDLEHITIVEKMYGMNTSVPGDYSTYLAEVDRSAYNSANPVEGWYYTKAVNNCEIRINYVNGDCDEELFRCRIEASYYDRFLYVDGKLIDFAEFRPSWDDGVFTTSDVSGGKVYTLECKGSYAGQEVHLKTSVTVTAKK